MRYLIHHRKLDLMPPLAGTNDNIFREEEDQGYYLQAIVPFTEMHAIAVFRRDVHDEES